MTELRLSDIPKLVFVKKHENAKLPTKNNQSDTGFDVYGIEDVTVPARGSAVIPTGIDVGYITPGYWFKVEGRSGLGFKSGLMPHGGIIDNGYRGNTGIKIYNLTDTDYHFKAGDKIAQIVVHINFEIQVEWGEKVESDRGEKGFGSSGR